MGEPEAGADLSDDVINYVDLPTLPLQERDSDHLRKVFSDTARSSKPWGAIVVGAVCACFAMTMVALGLLQREVAVVEINGAAVSPDHSAIANAEQMVGIELASICPAEDFQAGALNAACVDLLGVDPFTDPLPDWPEMTCSLRDAHDSLSLSAGLLTEADLAAALDCPLLEVASVDRYSKRSSRDRRDMFVVEDITQYDATPMIRLLFAARQIDGSGNVTDGRYFLFTRDAPYAPMHLAWATAQDSAILWGWSAQPTVYRRQAGGALVTDQQSEAGSAQGNCPSAQGMKDILSAHPDEQAEYLRLWGLMDCLQSGG